MLIATMAALATAQVSTGDIITDKIIRDGTAGYIVPYRVTVRTPTATLRVVNIDMVDCSSNTYQPFTNDFHANDWRSVDDSKWASFCLRVAGPLSRGGYRRR